MFLLDSLQYLHYECLTVCFLSTFSCRIQLRYDYIWSSRVGHSVGTANELALFDDEVIVQVRDFIDAEIFGIIPGGVCSIVLQFCFLLIQYNFL